MNEHECVYCYATDDLRPYGPDGADVCYPCGTSPEHIKETEKNIGALFDQIVNDNPEGGIVVLGDGAPHILKEDEQ